jgi:hypothetical protein
MTSHVIISILVLLANAAAPGQIHSVAAQKGMQEAHAIFSEVERGISEANVSLFSHSFNSQVHITLRDGESGLYSANQAYYLLQNYFRARKPLKCVFSTFGDSDTNPYATGSASFNIRGSREYVQVYVALALSGDRWVISHINIY